SGGILNPHGIDCDKVLAFLAEGKSIREYPEGEKISNEDLLKIPCDVLLPAALGGQITKDNAAQIQCKILAEGANAPTTMDADAILHDKNIFVIPDILCNAGGVVVSYFVWVQGLQSFFWSADEINKRLREILTVAFQKVLKVSQERR